MISYAGRTKSPMDSIKELERKKKRNTIIIIALQIAVLAIGI